MKIFKRIMLVLISLLLVLSVAFIVFFKTAPQIGGKPTGDRLARMQESSNFSDGVFVNQVETNMDMSWSTLRKVLSHYLFADKSDKSPRTILDVQAFKAEAFEAADDASLSMVWFGHSSVLMKIDGITILADPVLNGKRASMFPFMGPRRFAYDEYVTVEDLPKIDAVIISHDHYDHLDYPTIKALKEKVGLFYMPLGVGAHFERWGVDPDKIVEMEWWDEVQLSGLKLALTPTRHFSGRALNDRFRTLWGSWVILGKSRRIYFSGDSGYFSGFKEIGERYGPFDLTFMECGAYNEGWSEIHMFPEQTAQAHLDVKGKLLMPIHWGKFDLSLHPWKESVERLTKKAKEQNIDLFTPEIGEMVTLSIDSNTDRWWSEIE